MEENRENLGQKAARGVFWIGTTSYIEFAVSFATGIVLARRIDPAVFGFFAFASAISIFIRLVSGIGCQDFLIRHEKLEEHIVRTVFALACLLGTAIVLITLALYPFFIARLPLPVVVATGVLAVANGVAIAAEVPHGLMQRQFAMKKMALIQLVSGVGISVATLATVFLGGELSALLVQGAGGALVASLLYFLASPMRLRLGWDGGVVRQVFNRGKHFVGIGVIMTTTRQLDKVLIGSAFPEDQLGYYNRAVRMSGLFSILVPTAITRSLLPAFSTVRSDTPKLKFVYDLLVSMHLLILAPVGIGVYFASESLIELLYSAKWLPAAPLLRIMMPVVVVTPLLGIGSMLQVALNHPDRILRVRILAFVLFVPALWLGLQHFGLIGAAWALVLFEVVSFLGVLVLTAMVLGTATAIRPFVPHLVCTVLCFPPLEWVSRTGGFEALGAFWRLTALAGMTALIYGVALLAIDRKRLWTTVEFFIEKLGVSRAASA